MSEQVRRAVKIAGIDPGVRTGGLVVLRADRQEPAVLAAYSLGERTGSAKQAKAEAHELRKQLFGGWSDPEFLAVVLRAQNWLARALAALDAFEAEHGPIDFYAIETFVDQPSRLREERQQPLARRWHTPLLMGMLSEALAQRGVSVSGRIAYQNAGIVLPQWSAEISRLEKRRAKDFDILYEGDRLVTNDHTRKALAHALSLNLRLTREAHDNPHYTSLTRR